MWWYSVVYVLCSVLRCSVLLNYDRELEDMFCTWDRKWRIPRDNSSTFLETHGVKMIRHANRTCGMQGRYGTGVTIMRYGII